jgi:hypothetical protein
MSQVAAQEAGDCVEHSRGAHSPEAGTRMAVSRALRFPRRCGVPVESGRERSFVAFGGPGEDGIGSESRRDEGLVHPVAGERVDEPRRVADQQDPTVRSPSAEPAHGQSVSAHIQEGSWIEAVRVG